MVLTVACSKPVVGRVPLPSKVTAKDIKQAVQDAQAVCSASKVTPQCRIMWDRVSDLTYAFARQKEREYEKKRENVLEFWIEELETREYDV